MHLIFGIRGIKQFQDLFIRDIQAQYFPLKIKTPDGTEVDSWIQGAWRPFTLGEYVFPKEHYDLVMRSFGFGPPEKKYNYLGKYNFILRKLFKAKAVPKWESQGPVRVITNQHLHLVPVGIKEDVPEYTTPNARIHEGL